MFNRIRADPESGDRRCTSLVSVVVARPRPRRRRRPSTTRDDDGGGSGIVHDAVLPTVQNPMA